VTLLLTEKRYRQGLLWLLALGLVLRGIGLNWDGGRALHPDEGNLVRAALGLGLGGRWIPEFHAYNDLALWLPRLLSLPFCDGNDGACLTLVARGVSAALSWAMIWPGAALACRLAGGAGQSGYVAGLAAAGLLATSPALVQWAHFGTTESAMALLVVLLWTLAQRWQAGDYPDRAMALVSGVAIGVGFGFKTTALAMGLIPVLAIALAARPWPTKLRMLVILGLMAGAQALAFAPSVVMATEAWLAVMRFENGVVEGTTPVFWTAQFHGATPILYELRQLWGLLGLGLVLAAVGCRAPWRWLAPGVGFALVYAGLTFGWHAKFIRYLAPLVPVLLILAAVGLARLAQGRFGRAAWAAGLATVALMGVQGIDFAASYLRPDPRIVIEGQLRALAAPTDLVGIEPRDLGQTGGLGQITLPLTDPALTGPQLAQGLARADWVLIASRRNWEVLPRQPGAPAVLCSYYAGLADGALGFFPVARATRTGPLGQLFAPSLRAEETRIVFDRPEVVLLRNIDRLPPEALEQRLSQPRAAHDCAPRTLQRGWRLGQ
jgi:hypothetical protein